MVSLILGFYDKVFKEKVCIDLREVPRNNFEAYNNV